ncbi:MAG: AbrB family transcriptional regulator [Thermoplasmata archaeon]|nr:MAG: AbrB family transcriptional regulator [Thermoplasmata archaeon]
MIVRNILAKGQVVIPKTIRELLGLNIGDEILIDVKDGKIILSKKERASKIFYEISRKSRTRISIDEIKETLKERYGEE